MSSLPQVPVQNKVTPIDFDAINTAIDVAEEQAQKASRERDHGGEVVSQADFFNKTVAVEEHNGVGAGGDAVEDEETVYAQSSTKELVSEISMLKRQMRYLERRETNSLNKANAIHRKIIDAVWEIQRSKSGSAALNLPYDDRSNCILVDPVELLALAKGAIKILVSEHQDMERDESMRLEIQRKRCEAKMADLEKQTVHARHEKFSSEQALKASEQKRCDAEHHVEQVLRQSDETLKRVVAEKDKIAKALQESVEENHFKFYIFFKEQ